MKTITLNIADLNINYELKVLMFGTIASIILGLIVIVCNIYLNWNEPDYIMLECDQTGEFYISHKRWYGYTCIESFKTKEIAEKYCSELNKIKK